MIIPEGLTLKESPIHGLGIFAERDFPKDYCLGPFIGTEMTIQAFKEKYGKDVRYCYQLGRLNKIIVAKEERNWITYLNERNPPNVYLKRRSCYTACEIKQSEELFLIYKGPVKYPKDYSLEK